MHRRTAYCGAHLCVHAHRHQTLHSSQSIAALQKAHLTAAALGVGLVAMGEPLGADMAARMLEHLLSYGDPAARAAVPLALALLRPSAPDVAAMDTLSRLSHDADHAVARAAVLALGVMGAGSNNARLAGAPFVSLAVA